MGCDFITSRMEAALLGENDERGRIWEPFLTRRERSSLDGIKSNQNHAARSPFRSRKIQPLHIPCHRRPASPVYPPPSPSSSFSSRTRGTGRGLTVVQFSASLSRPVRMRRDRELVQKTRIRFTRWRGERKKVWIRVARTGTSAEIFFHGFSPRIAF